MSIFDDPSFNADESRMNRQDRLNQPEFAPSQNPMSNNGDLFSNGNDSLFGDSLGGTDLFGNSNSLGGSISTNGNEVGSLFSGGDNSSIMGNMPQQPQKSEEDIFWDTVITGAKGLGGFLKELGSSTGNLTPLFWQDWGFSTTKVSLGLLALGIVLFIIGKSAGIQLILGSCISGAFGICIMFFETEKARTCTSMYKDDNSSREVKSDNNTNDDSSLDLFSDSDNNSNSNESTFTDDNDFFTDLDDIDDETDDDDPYLDDLDDDDYDDEFTYKQGEDGEDVNSALSNLQEVPQGLYTRQYLWDMFTRVLPTMIPDFSKMREIDEDDDAFLEWGDSLRDAAEVAGCNEDYLPELLSLKENLFTVVLTCDRPKGFKPEQVANELSNIYAYQGGTFNGDVFAKADTVGKNCIITIFTGKSAMISLKDMMLNVKDYILDTNNYIPVVFGTDQLGNVIHYDLKKLESIIITGMPRSGKSWFCQAVLTQMCAFVSPKELNLYICDPKEGISDFKAFTLPHVKKFVSEDKKILDTLRELVKVEGPRRKKIIGDAGFVNVWDYKERYPDVELPIIYAVVDEIVTLASRMDKETNNEFRMLLRELISQLPALGIRAFLIPHVLNNDIIEKKVSDLVPCKISVRGDADHIEKATGSKFKDFPYKLTHNGDMAVKMPSVSPNTMFVHGPALTSSNPKNNELFDYLRRVWSKLESSSVSDSVANGVQDELDNDSMAQEVLINLDNKSEDFEEINNKVSNDDIIDIDDNIDLDDFFS